jgi:sterol desaturase/sphingolipid hydroxylase (fatty acid hydroxylase superfamily)
MIGVLVSAGVGAFGWTLAEYLMHRFDGHGMKGKTRFSRAHLDHHRDPSTFAPAWLKLQLAALVVSCLAAISWWLMGSAGLAFTTGFATMYGFYEWLHRREHTHPPTTAWGHWARRHHFHHHFNAPNLNHGVTTDLWDRVFGTLAPAEQVRVPRRHAPHWMVRPEDGELRARYVGQYVLAGRSALKRANST